MLAQRPTTVWRRTLAGRCQCAAAGAHQYTATRVIMMSMCTVTHMRTQARTNTRACARALPHAVTARVCQCACARVCKICVPLNNRRRKGGCSGCPPLAAAVPVSLAVCDAAAHARHHPWRQRAAGEHTAGGARRGAPTTPRTWQRAGAGVVRRPLWPRGKVNGARPRPGRSLWPCGSEPWGHVDRAAR